VDGYTEKEHQLKTFTELGLASPILKALEGEGYTTPTPIQAKAIPPVMEGADLLGIAQTGTGKTAAFALPILHRLAENRKPAPRRGCRVLVLSPTRELASQIAASFKTYGRHLGISVATVFGGVAHRPQRQALSRGVDVLVATPGRLLDHVAQRDAVLDGTEVFVLDEADQMLDLGFVKPIRQIVAQLATRRQNLFFSATMPKEISGLADELLRDPVKVSVAPVATTAERVDQRIIHIEARKKRALLAELLADENMSRTLVFTRTKRGADRVARHLETGGIQVAAIHGNKSQRQREEALFAFRKAKIRVLVATDIAARGIDVDLVSHVVNFELPEVPEAYVHRIGRTARAGASGIAISLCDGAERNLLRSIERLTRQTIPSEDRRNDTTLEADRGPDRSPVERRGYSRRDGDDRGKPRQHARNGARPKLPRGQRHADGDDARGRDRGDNRGARVSPGRSDDRNGNAPSRDGRQPRNGAGASPEGRIHRNGNGARPNDKGAKGRNESADLSGVAFLARSGKPIRANGKPHGQRRNDRQSSRTRGNSSSDRNGARAGSETSLTERQ
jgi:ATP-dependent RNA helicase RhlE